MKFQLKELLRIPLLARGRDRLETALAASPKALDTTVPYSLGDAIDWKLDLLMRLRLTSLSPTR